MRFFRFFFLLLLLTAAVRGQSKAVNPLFSVSNRVKFAAHLYETEDYIRAFDEYRALLTETPDDTLRLAAGLALRNLGRFDEAEDYLKGLFFFSRLKNYAKTEFLKTEFIRGNYSDFINLSGESFYRPDTFSVGIKRLKYFTYLILPETEITDSAEFVSGFAENQRRVISKFYSVKKRPERKDELLAAALSAVIPGAGKIYTEDYSDGIVAFIFSGLFYGLAAHNFAIDKNAKGALFAGIGLFFHAGSVYGSATSAQIYNARKRFEFESKLIEYARKEKYFLPDAEKLFIKK